MIPRIPFCVRICRWRRATVSFPSVPKTCFGVWTPWRKMPRISNLRNLRRIGGSVRLSHNREGIDPGRILKQLTYPPKKLPREALREADQARAQIAPHLLASLADASLHP